ncbi:fimbrial protein [Pseudomonas sp. Irchel 3E20]|uniref:fimbrial protein n=1 Tax=Pseudomonas sp. Irchel 3E20 TaxID=2008983 RepID=UPI001595F20A|nr:fimbrial protein [Pseudomonas sp. Irchel 3E20]
MKGSKSLLLVKASFYCSSLVSEIFIMKKNVIALGFLAASSVFAGAALAADGTINITGEIRGITCTISGGTGGAPGSGANFPVVLDTIQNTALSAEGESAGAKPFAIYVGGQHCPDGTNVAVLYEIGSPAISPTTGNLRNRATSSPASNVEVQIIDRALANDAVIDLRKGQSTTAAQVTSGLATLPFAARYVAVGGAASPGKVETSVQYSVTFP